MFLHPEVSTTPVFLPSQLMANHGIQAVFAERGGGCSPSPFNTLNTGFGIGDEPLLVAKNVQALCIATAMPTPHRAQQVHGMAMQWYAGKGQNHNNAADVLLTAEAGCAVAVQTADCVPVLLAHPATGLVAAIHAGWRGTAQNIVGKVCDTLLSRGVLAAEIIVSIGPAIGGCCFAIDANTFKALAKEMPQSMDASLPLHANLAAINRQQLIAKGIPPTSIELISPCTACHPERFFSYRRDGGTTGRQLSMIRSPISVT